MMRGEALHPAPYLLVIPLHLLAKGFIVLRLPLLLEGERLLLGREHPQMGVILWAVAEADYDAMLGIDV